MAERTLTVRIVGDDSSLQRTFQRDAQKSQQFSVGIAGLGKNFLAAGAAAGVAAVSFQSASAIIGASIQNASDLNEEISKSQQIFGDSADEIKDWSKTTATALGISQVEALRATGTYGALFKTLGFVDDANAEMSKSLVQLASDMASFNNASPEDVLLAIRSGLVGEAEPLRKYGVFLSEARVQQLALVETGKKNVRSLTDQEKAHARYNIILQDTASAQGDFARTSEGLANQQRILRAQLRNASAAFGSLLIPKILETVGAIEDLIDAWKRLEGAIPGGRGASRGFFGELFKSLPAQFEDQIDNLKRMKEDIDLILQGRGFEPRPSEHPFTDVGKAVSKDLQGLSDELDASVPIAAKIAAAIQKPVDELNAALLTAREKLLKAQRLAERREAERAGKAWNEFLLGMGLKLDIASISQSQTDDLAVLRETERAIERRIASEGRTFKLATELARVRKQIADTTASIAADAAQATQDAFDDILDALDLKLDIAKTTRTFNDDIRILRQIEAQILARIRAEGRTTELLRQLFENRQEQAQTLRDQRNAAAFAALGLTPEGDRPTPSGRALLRRARSLQQQLKGTTLDTGKTGRELRRIVNFLVDNFRTAGKEVRDAILGMLNDISSALESQDKPQGPLTKFAKTGIGKLIAGLGLTTEQERALFARMSAVGPNFAVPTRGTAAFGARVGAGAEVGPRPADQPIVVHVFIDGKEVETTVTRRQQRTQGRNARSRRGVRPGH